MEYLLLIAILPGAILLKYVYDKDKIDKESKKLLRRLLIFGALAAIPAFIWELVGEVVLVNIFGDYMSVAYSLAENFLVVAIAEEVCKYLMMRFNTWKNPEFNCSFDGIVYAVYASLGFAILENILYVFENGITTGLVRAISSVPGHAFFGVFMGLFYGKAREAANNGDSSACTKYKVLAILTPVLAHGLYDFCCEYIIAWLLLLVVLYILGFRTVKQSSEQDTYISRYAPQAPVDVPMQAPAAPVTSNFVPGQPPVQPESGRFCPFCGAPVDGKFCRTCGKEQP